MNKYLILALVFFVSFAPHALAEGFVALAPIPDLTQGVVADSAGLAAFLNNLYKYLIGLAAVLAVIEIIWGGLEISTKDSVSKQSDGKERITQAIFGLVLVLSPVVVFSIINPSILNLSLSLTPLDTKSGGSSQSQSATNESQASATAAATAAGCNVTGTLLKTASCPSQQAAQQFATSCSTGSGGILSSQTSVSPCSAWQKTETIDAYTTAIGGTPNCTTYPAICDTTKGPMAGPYSFADTSTGVLAAIFGYSNYEPLASTPTNPNNGAAVLQFASACTADGGTTCMSTVKLPCLSSSVQVITTGATPSTSCWNISLSCTKGSTGAGGCSSNPKFTVVQTK